VDGPKVMPIYTVLLCESENMGSFIGPPILSQQAVEHAMEEERKADIQRVIINVERMSFMGQRASETFKRIEEAGRRAQDSLKVLNIYLRGNLDRKSRNYLRYQRRYERNRKRRNHV